jgi:hypothetical protein
MTRPLTLALLLLLPLWVGAQTVAEDKPLKLEAASVVSYGGVAYWDKTRFGYTYKVLQAGTYTCSNAAFGDPIYGVAKQCTVYPVNQANCGIVGANIDVSWSTIPAGAWMSQWCPMADGTTRLQVLVATWDAAPGAVRCFLQHAAGTSQERVKSCAPDDVTRAPLAAIWSDSKTLARIIATRPL